MLSPGAVLRDARRRAGLSLRETAEQVRALGVPCSHTYIAKIELGEQPDPVEGVLLALADVLGLPRSEVQALFRILPEHTLEARQPDLFRIKRALDPLPDAKRRRAVDAIEALLTASDHDD